MMVILVAGALGLFILGLELAGKAVIRLAKSRSISLPGVAWIGKDDLRLASLLIWLPVVGTMLPQIASVALACLTVVLILHLMAGGNPEKGSPLDSVAGSFAGLGLMLLGMHFFVQTGASLGVWLESIASLPVRMGGGLMLGLVSAALFRSFLPLTALALTLSDSLGIETVAMVMAGGLPGEALGGVLKGVLTEMSGGWKRDVARVGVTKLCVAKHGVAKHGWSLSRFTRSGAAGILIAIGSFLLFRLTSRPWPFSTVPEVLVFGLLQSSTLLFVCLLDWLFIPGSWKKQHGRSGPTGHSQTAFPEDSLESELLSLRYALADALGAVKESLLALMNSFSGEGWDGDGFLASAELVVHAEMLNAGVGLSLAKIIETPRQDLQAGSLLAIQGISHETGRIVEASRALADNLTKRSVKGFRFHDEADAELVECIALILDFLRYCEDALGLRLGESVKLDLAGKMYEGIRKTGTQLRKRARKAMEKGGAGIREELAFLDILGELEAVAWRSLVIAKSLPALDELHRERFCSDTAGTF